MAVWNFHVIVERELSLKNVLEALRKNLGLHAKIGQVCSMKNWEWEDETKLNHLNEVPSMLSLGRIVVVSFDSKELDNFGVYIENVNCVYIYSFWFDADETMPHFMSEKALLQHLYTTSVLYKLETIISECCADFYTIAFGEETVFNYCKSMSKMVETSHNIFFWLFRQCDDFKSFYSLQKIGDIACLKASLYVPCQTKN